MRGYELNCKLLIPTNLVYS